MATEPQTSVEEITKNVENVDLNSNRKVEMPLQNGYSKSSDVDNEAVKKEWGFDLPELYRIVVKFYKEQSGKAVQLTYSERCHLVALCQQVTQGPYDVTSATAQTLGIMDVVGRDRRVAWQSLGEISCSAAKLEFVKELHRLAPTLKPYVEACWAAHLHQLQLQQEKQLEEERLKQEQELLQQDKIKEEETRRRQEQTKREIQAALNQQTYAQFRVYAEHQFPGNPEQQGVLIRQLQDQHYQQYMQQVYQQQLQKQQQACQQQQQEQQLQEVVAEKMNENAEEHQEEEGGVNNGDGDAVETTALVQDSDQEENNDEGSTDDQGSIAAAAMWTRKDVKDFKGAVTQDGPNTVLRVGHGETVTVRVPTHQDGSCLFWEFATDAYDIGFGLFFEWTTDGDDADTAVTVQVTESDDEDDEDEDDEDDDFDGPSADDVERGGRGASGKEGSGKGSSKSSGPAPTVIIPVYRRDCHEEVYAGSHTYPGTGVYLLKFDNSYSVWRSKTLYYRVYYTQ